MTFFSKKLYHWLKVKFFDKINFRSNRSCLVSKESKFKGLSYLFMVFLILENYFRRYSHLNKFFPFCWHFLHLVDQVRRVKTWKLYISLNSFMHIFWCYSYLYFPKNSPFTVILKCPKFKGGTRGSPIMPRDVRLVSRTANVGTVGMNGLSVHTTVLCARNNDYLPSSDGYGFYPRNVTNK